ncbi:MAG: hypothetical protein LBI58_06980 [Tannerellaceae bacterium]|nr:hypothetical protein [Tannerellaceae bacterium]
MERIDNNLDRFGMGKGAIYGDWYRNEFKPVYNEYLPVYADWLDIMKRTPYVSTILSGIEKRLRPLTRELYWMIKGNRLITSADLIAMDLPHRSNGEYRKSAVATLPPAFNITPLESNRLLIHYYSEYSGDGRGKPKGQHGAEIGYTAGDEVVTDADSLEKSLISTSSPYTMAFTSREQGKTVNIALRWENTRGEKGPWSKVMSLVIP